MIALQNRTFRQAAAAASVAGACLLSACSMGDVELNGGIFDVMGISSSQQRAPRETKLAPRAPLVMPPNQAHLPDPNQAVAQGSADQSWPVDPEEKRRAEGKRLADQQAAYCRDGNWKDKAMNDPTADRGPAGACNQNSILSGFTNWMSGSNK